MLCIATGLVGNRDPQRNFSMTFFWIVFVLLIPCLCALLGNFYAALNPWRALVGAIERVHPGFARGRVAYPAWLGDWPLSGLLHDRPRQLATVVFALAMLSTTAFDGLRATRWWVNLFRGGPHRSIHRTGRPAADPRLRIAAPLVHRLGNGLAAGLAIPVPGDLPWLPGAVTRSTRPLRELALDFGYTLLPIALAYNITHYATLLLSQGLKIVSLASDPFGWGWNLLGTAELLR